MKRLLRIIGVLVGALLFMPAACSSVNEALDCDQLCRELSTCVDSTLDVQKCAQRCEDNVSSKSERADLDACTDCLDKGYACAEVTDRCPICETVKDRFID